jgi:hypothetical protein
MFVFCFVFFTFHSVYSVSFIVLCTVSPSAYSCLFDNFVQAYRPLPPGGKPNCNKNKYHIVLYHTSNDVAEKSAVWGVRAEDGGHVLFLRDAGKYHSTGVKSQSRNLHLCAACAGAGACTHR